MHNCKEVGQEHIVMPPFVLLSARCKRMLGWRCLQNPQGHSRKNFPSWKEQEEERLLPRRHIGHGCQLHQVRLGLIEPFPMWSTSPPHPTYLQANQTFIHGLPGVMDNCWRMAKGRDAATQLSAGGFTWISVCVEAHVIYIYIYKADTLLCGSCLFVDV